MSAGRRRAACLAAALLAGCAVAPGDQRAALDLPSAHRGATPAQSARSIADVPWWEVFEDPQLVALIEEALRDNVDLAIAASVVAEANAVVTLARSPIFPRVGGDVRGSRTNQNVNFTGTTSFVAALALAWEIDFWGRYLRATEAARASLLATEAGRSSVVASLVAGVAQQYLVIKGLRQRLGVVQRAAALQRDSLRLVTLLARQGVQSAAEVRQAEGQLLTTLSQVPEIERQIAQAEDALALLLGKPPRDFALGGDPPRLALPPEVPLGVPSALLERRPDIRQAEQQLVAANANIGVARAAFFPTISLTGTLGRASDALHRVVSGRDVGTAAVAATVPIFQGGALVANLDIARARAEQAALAYRRTVLVALQEVADALVALDRFRAAAENDRERARVTAQSLRLAELRFRSGVISHLEVLDAQRQLFAAESDLTASELNQRLAAVQLYRALGGGWR